MAGEFGTIGGNGRRTRWPAVAVGIILFAFVGAGGYYLGVQRSAGVSDPSDDASVVVVETTPEEPAQAEPIGADEVTWYVRPEKLTPTPEIFRNVQAFYERNDAAGLESYEVPVYAVGSYRGGRVLIAIFPNAGLGFAGGIVRLWEADGTYKLLRKYAGLLFSTDQPGETASYSGPDFTPSVTVDNTTEFQSITYQPSITLKSVALTAASNDEAFLDAELQPIHQTFGLGLGENDTLAEFAKIDAGTVYLHSYAGTDTVGNTASGLALQKYVLHRPDFSAVTYQHRPTFLKDDGTIAVKTVSGTTTATYRIDGASGCGSADAVAVITSGSLEDFTKIGTTVDTGEPLYAPSSASNPILKYYYEATGGQAFRIKANGDSETVTFTPEEYRQANAVVVYEDPLGRVLILLNTDYGPNTECGKPVIYLYPTHPTDVSVQVGAEITVSEPAYGDGWQVLAEPSGRLTLADGTVYDSLFWEGLGHGSYPPIMAGFVVAKNDLESTLRDHLAKLGLNAKESADFLEFWLPRMPSTPYTRLTWFGTRQMDELAPLTVSPAPDTSIRVFLDFVGIDQKIDLLPQRLSAPARHGFTLVEWGGLLRK